MSGFAKLCSFFPRVMHNENTDVSFQRKGICLLEKCKCTSLLGHGTGVHAQLVTNSGGDCLYFRDMMVRRMHRQAASGCTCVHGRGRYLCYMIYIMDYVYYIAYIWYIIYINIYIIYIDICAHLLYIELCEVQDPHDLCNIDLGCL